MVTEEQLRSDFGKFADLDSEVVVTTDNADFLVSFAQNGDAVDLRLCREGGRVIESRLGEVTKYQSYFGLLASANFGNLKRLAAAQLALLGREAAYIQDPSTHLPIVGELEAPDQRESGRTFYERIEHWLTSGEHAPNDVRALVIDGPAGIGKTHLIRRLSYERAAAFGPGSAPPLLHVQSRGRKLTTLNDVLSGTLDTLRVGLTFDQVPLLVRYGLLQVAIDGFDELADPHGYENAWHLVLEFVQSVRGEGVVILAGRDTFIDVKAVRKAVSILTEANTGAAHLRPLTRGEAADWLAASGWSRDQLNKLGDTGLFEEGSYALRPFFISEINQLRDEAGFDDFVEFPLQTLVRRIITREVKLLEPFMKGLPAEQISRLMLEFFQEVARSMSDAETDRLDTGSLQLVCEMVFGDYLNEESMSVLRHRVAAFALLEQDTSPDDRRFSHSEIQDYFLSLNYIALIRQGQTSKSLSRNIVGTDLLDTFRDVVMQLKSEGYNAFCGAARRRLEGLTTVAQEHKNVSALLLAASERFDELQEPLNFAGFGLDEICLRGEASAFQLSHGTISFLDARGCDFSKARFEDVIVTTLLADETTRLPETFAEPYNLQVVREGRVMALFEPKERTVWLNAHTASEEAATEESEAWRLAVRIARVIVRQNWIREVEDDLAGKLLRSPEWPAVRDALQRHGLLQVRTGVATAGPRSDFYRVLNAEDFLAPEPTPVVKKLRKELHQ